MNDDGIINSDTRLLSSWRYVSPTKAKSQNYHEAFILRPEDKGKLSFDVNSRDKLDQLSKRSEIYEIYRRKSLPPSKFTPSKTGIFIMIDLINSQKEANIGETYLSPKIDGISHCSLEYLNEWYEDAILRNEIFNILYNNIDDQISAVQT